MSDSPNPLAKLRAELMMAREASYQLGRDRDSASNKQRVGATWSAVSTALAAVEAEREGMRAEITRLTAEIETIRHATEEGGPWPSECIAEIDALEEKWDIDLCSTGFAGKMWRLWEAEHNAVARLTADCARKDAALRQAQRVLCDYEADAEDSTVSNMIADIHDVLGDSARDEGVSDGA